jgi:ADP-ribose pyrophosphatase
MNRWRTLSRHTILSHSKYLLVERHRVQLPDGQVIPDWPWVVAPDYVNVLPVTPEGRFLCFRQVKYALETTSLAPVGGYIDDGENPLEAARRELLEEAGSIAADWVDLGRYVVDGNRGFATAYLYMAREARQVAAPDADDLEEMEVVWLDETELETALVAGAFGCLAWAMTVAQALLYLRRAREGQNCGR